MFVLSMILKLMVVMSEMLIHKLAMPTLIVIVDGIQQIYSAINNWM